MTRKFPTNDGKGPKIRGCPVQGNEMYQAPRVNSKYPPILDLKRPDARIRLFSNVLCQTFENGFPAAGGVILVKGVVGRPGRRQHLFPTPRKSTPSAIENHAAN